ncbi:MAG: DUF2299 family protein [Candidatus Helarchaeota archaeon]
MTKDKELYAKISQWCKEEGIFDKKITSPEHEFIIRIQLPTKLRMEIAKPNDKPFIVLSCKTTIAPQHWSILQKGTNLIKFKEEVINFICSRPLDVAFNPKNPQYVLVDRIFLDGLSQNNFFGSIREITHAFQKILIILNKICGLRPSEPIQMKKPTFYG